MNAINKIIIVDKRSINAFRKTPIAFKRWLSAPKGLFTTKSYQKHCFFYLEKMFFIEFEALRGANDPLAVLPPNLPAADGAPDQRVLQLIQVGANSS